MESTQVQVYFDISKKGRGKRAQALLRLLKEKAESSQHRSFTLNEDAEPGHVLYFYRTDAPGVVRYDLPWMNDYRLPATLSVLQPLRVVLTGNHHFNFPEEGIYEGGGEVIWRVEWHNTDYDSQAPAIAEYTWQVTIEATSVEGVFEQLRSIRDGSAIIKHRWVNRFPLSMPTETGEVSVPQTN